LSYRGRHREGTTFNYCFDELQVKLKLTPTVLASRRGLTGVQLLPFLQQLLFTFLIVGVGYTAIHWADLNAT